jgi:protein TonB
VASKAIIASIVLHLLVAVGLASMSIRRRSTTPVTIEVVDGAGRRSHAPPAARAPAAAIGAVASLRPTFHRAPPAPAREAPRPAEPPAPSSAAAPLDTGLTLGNESGSGDGVSLPRAGPKRSAPPHPPARPPAVTKKRIAEPLHPAEEECHEAPSKPAPLARPIAIEYTRKAQEDGVEGRLVLAITVGADGAVSQVQVTAPVEPSLDAAAVAAVKTWRFQPALRCGKPIPGGVYTIARRFELGD